MYKVIVRFIDLQDDNHVYNAGDTFPRKGKVVSDARINELKGTENKRKMSLIEEVVSTPAPAPEPAPEAVAEEASVEEVAEAPVEEVAEPTTEEVAEVVADAEPKKTTSRKKK